MCAQSGQLCRQSRCHAGGPAAAAAPCTNNRLFVSQIFTVTQPMRFLLRQAAGYRVASTAGGGGGWSGVTRLPRCAARCRAATRRSRAPGYGLTGRDDPKYSCTSRPPSTRMMLQAAREGGGWEVAASLSAQSVFRQSRGKQARPQPATSGRVHSRATCCRLICMACHQQLAVKDRQTVGAHGQHPPRAGSTHQGQHPPEHHGGPDLPGVQHPLAGAGVGGAIRHDARPARVAAAALAGAGAVEPLRGARVGEQVPPLRGVCTLAQQRRLQCTSLRTW